jgi:ATP-binding cassette, subfamily B, multidrug efflux pump
MQAAMISAEHIFGVLDLTPAIQPPPGGGRAAPRPQSPAVVFRDVWFAYGGDEFILKDCSFAIRRGEHVALVGATGEGKTTCGRLLNRSYDVSRGAVLVDGLDVRAWDLTGLRRHVGLVFQDAVLFTGTVEGNLAVGAEASASREALVGAADAANARAFIEALPRGWLTELGERGANISYGERQYLALARALVYNPAILVLDEATSSIDPESEALIQTAMSRLLAGRTSITIAHRLSTIQSADRILVLHRGRIHEEGDHTALLRRGGLYARFCELQFGADAARA